MRYSFTLCLIVVLLVIGCQNKEKTEIKKKERIIPVEVTVPEIKDLERMLDFTGTVKAKEEVYVVPDLPGRFIKYLKSEGSTVKKDEPIAHIERDVPGVEYKPLVVKAPIDGRIAQASINKGQVVSPQVPIARILDISSLYLEVAIPERYSNNIKKGDPLLVENSNKTIETKVNWLSSFLDPMNKTKTIKASLPVKSFQANQAVKVHISVEKESKALVIPTNAVLYTDSSFVMLYRDGVAEKRVVEVGMSNGEYLSVTGGLTATDTVITLGAGIVRDGQKVKIIQR